MTGSANVLDSDGVQSVSLLFRAVTPKNESSEVSVAMKRVSGDEKSGVYSAGIKGGLVGGVAMAIVALAYGITAYGSVWYPINLLAVLGPGIRTYELQHFAAAADGDRRDDLGDYVTPTESGASVMFDLFGFARHLLVLAGVPDGQIFEFPEIDTLTDERFASHRRSKATGEPEWRHGALIGFAPDD